MSSPASGESSGGGASKAIRASSREPHGGIADDPAVDGHFAGLDQRLEPGARQRDAARRRRLAEMTVEPFAGARLVDVEDLPADRRGQRDAWGGLWAATLGSGSTRGGPGALFGLGVHARSRRRGALGRLRGGRRDERPKRGDDRLDVRTRPRSMGVEAAPHRRHMSRRIAAAAANDARAAIDGESGVDLPSAPACRNSGYPRHAIAARRRWPWRSAARRRALRSWRGSRPGDRKRRRRNSRHRRSARDRRLRRARRNAAGATPIIVRPAVSKLAVIVHGMPHLAAASAAARISSGADMVSIHATSAPPSCRPSICSTNTSTASSSLSGPSGARRSPVGPTDPATTTGRPAASATLRAFAGGEAVELAGAVLKPVQHQAAAIGRRSCWSG